MVSVMKNKQKSMKKGSTVPGGGSAKMLKGQHTGTQTPGVTSQQKKGGGGGFGVKGGNGHMFGKSGVKPLKPA